MQNFKLGYRYDHINYIAFNNLIEYNLLLNKRRIIFSSKWRIYNYLVTYDSVIILLFKDYLQHGNCFYKQICWNGHPLNISKQELDKLRNFRLLNIAGKKYITNSSCINLYGINSSIKLNGAVPDFISSKDGRKIVYIIDGSLCVQNVFDISINQLFDINHSQVYWNMFSLLGILHWTTVSDVILMDIDTIINFNKKALMHPHNLYSTYTGDLLKLDYNLFVYDSKYDFITEIQNYLNFVLYNKWLGILITKNMHCYQIRRRSNVIEFTKVIFKCNYLLDCDFVGIRVLMDTLLDILDLPIEIVCVELYCSLLVCYM